MTKTNIYTLGIGDIARRIACFNRTIQDDKYNLRRSDPMKCWACGVKLEKGERVATRLCGKLSHIYHIKCAAAKNIV
jgi:hypothetical protein